MTSIHDLHQIAHDMGIRLTHHTGGIPGFYLDTYKTISTRRSMAIWDYKTVLAHELGHAHYRDKRCGHKHFDEKQERRADEYAANLLICPHQLAHLIPWHGNDLNSLAADLEVTPHLLKIYLQMNPEILKGLAA